MTRGPKPSRRKKPKGKGSPPVPEAQTGRIPVLTAKRVADRHRLSQVILFGWDGAVEHCVTYGTTVQDCDQAAFGGDRIKKALGWSHETMGHLPPRVQDLRNSLNRLTVAAQQVVDDWDEDAPDYTPAVERLRAEIKRANEILPT